MTWSSWPGEVVGARRAEWSPDWTIAALLVLVATTLGLLESRLAFRAVDDRILEARMGAAPRPATGDVVLIGLDSRSLREAGAWPWPREVYGEMATRLRSLGATDIVLDIDFSAPSDAESDARFAQALEEAGGLVILPIFRQGAGVGAAAGETVLNAPLAAFREHAWLASVNFRADRDGQVRTFPWGLETEDGPVLSVPAALAGLAGPLDGAFAINFSVGPTTVPTYSAADLLDGTLARSQIEGRSVVVGGHAVEFSDALAVPVHGVVNGAMLHVLAAETLLQGIVPTPVRSLPVIVAVTALGLVLTRSRFGQRPLRAAIGLLLVAVAVEALAFLLMARHAIVLHTTVLHGILAATAAASLLREYADRDGRLQVSEQEGRDSREALSRLVEESADGVVIAGRTGAVLEINAEGASLLGLPHGGDGRPADRPPLPDGLADLVATAMRAREGADEDRSRSGRFVLARAGGDVHLDYTLTPVSLSRQHAASLGTEERAVCRLTVRDVSAGIEQAARIARLERYDPLTDALRRAPFLAELARGLAGEPQTVFVLNLHRFGNANRTFGREVGDAVLRRFVRRIRTVDDRIAAVSRIGGDIFAVSCPGLDGRDAQVLAMKFLAAVAEPFVVDDLTVRLKIRIGLAHGRPGDEAGALLGHAEIAMEKAREVAGEGIRTFEALAAQGQERFLRIEQALWTAIDNGELHLLYQPQVVPGDGRIIAAEALVRWTHPTLGPISPGEFVPIAESNGFIEPLGRWVLDRACRDAAAWPDDVSIAVNVSALQFARGDIVADVRRTLGDSGLDPRRLQLEITESLFVANAPEIVDAMNELRGLGIVLALDDFGAGFSSLGYLSTLPVDKLKLDRAFVQGLDADASQVVIVKSVIALARDLSLQFICEGVETEAQRDRLVSLGCEQIQGYLFGRPMPLDAFRSRIEPRRTSDALA